ncbi:hypothetical protein C8D87_103503 [Lentzea atacamensis]|uniref:Uncharacterized protein n=1 Tax=Lentzea atacamensis TaxID=531938 RepID=A0ABX9EC95_9PSEU|nr:hypothetical protein C8D87_103503 [Lentzea atacamensis]
MNLKAATPDVSAGESLGRLDALRTWAESPLFDAREKAALALAEAITLVHDGRVPDEVYRAGATEYDAAGAAVRPAPATARSARRCQGWRRSRSTRSPGGCRAAR